MADVETKEKEGKAIFEGGVKDGEGKYTEAPSEFNFSKFKPLKKSEFLGAEVYLDHQGNICQAKAEIFQRKADKGKKQAERLRALGDPETRKRAAKLQKMRESLATLEAQLIEDGVDLNILTD